MVSQVIVTKDGRTVEVGVVGKEGYVGAGLAAGLSRSSVREIIQIAGDGFRMMGNALERILRSAPQLQVILNRHIGASRNASRTDRGVQSAAQYTAASLEVAADDSGSGGFRSASDHPRFHCDHDGYRPVHCELGSGSTAKKGIIEYVRGAVKIVNRRKLEKSACECYDVIRQFEDDLGLR
jgi:hypothetical protein